MYSTTLTSSYYENFQNKISSLPCYPMDIINYRFTDDTYPMVDSTCLNFRKVLFHSQLQKTIMNKSFFLFEKKNKFYQKKGSQYNRLQEVLKTKLKHSKQAETPELLISYHTCIQNNQDLPKSYTRWLRDIILKMYRQMNTFMEPLMVP